MSVKILVRQELPAPPLHLLENDILSRAEQELSYHHASQVKYDLKAMERASEIFKACKIQPFTEKSVAKYKGRVWWKDVLSTLGMAIATVVVAGALMWGFLSFANYIDPKHERVIGFVVGAVGVITGIIGAIATICILVVGLSEDSKQWRISSLEEYEGPVPAFALLTALNIRREAYKNGNGSVPAFHVEMRAADPFLVVRFGSDSYYVEVWDEPGFERERKA